MQQAALSSSIMVHIFKNLQKLTRFNLNSNQYIKTEKENRKFEKGKERETYLAGRHNPEPAQPANEGSPTLTVSLALEIVRRETSLSSSSSTTTARRSQ
jgi:hypothetical protein